VRYDEVVYKPPGVSKVELVVESSLRLAPPSLAGFPPPPRSKESMGRFHPHGVISEGMSSGVRVTYASQ